MPTRTVTSALVKFHFSHPNAPRCFPKWQEITGVLHGLFPSDDDQLPNGWTRDMATQIQSYFDQFRKKKTEDEKVKFAAYTRKIGKDIVPGRALFRTYVTERYSKAWNIHGIISGILSDNNVHPVQIMSAMGNFEKSPSSTLYLPTVLDAIGLALFGPESFDRTNHLQYELRDPTWILAQRTWTNLLKAHSRDSKRLDKLEAKVKAAFEGESPRHVHFPLADWLVKRSNPTQ